MKEAENAANSDAARKTEWKSRKSDRLVRAELVLNGLKTDFLQQFRKIEKQRESHAIREKQIRNEYFFKRRNLQVQHELATKGNKPVTRWKKEEVPVQKDPEPVFQHKLFVPRLKLDARLHDWQQSNMESTAAEEEAPVRYIDSIRSQVTRVEVSQEERARLLAMGATTARDEGGENVALATFTAPHWTSLLTKSWNVTSAGSVRPQTTRDPPAGSASSRWLPTRALTSRSEQRSRSHASALLAAERATNELYMVLNDMNQRSLRRSLSGDSLTGSRSPMMDPVAVRGERSRPTEKTKIPSTSKREAEGQRRLEDKREKEEQEEVEEQEEGQEEEQDGFEMVHATKFDELKIVGSFPKFSSSNPRAGKNVKGDHSRKARPATNKPVNRLKARTRTAPARSSDNGGSGLRNEEVANLHELKIAVDEGVVQWQSESDSYPL
ncbi:hypothetical protein GUITHDRAFT_148692, partial [Guillardia theta CCMP2712]